MDLLEREGHRRPWARVRDEAAEGRGSVVLVAEEPGIGKTALITRFAEDRGDDSRILWVFSSSASSSAMIRRAIGESGEAGSIETS